MLLNRVEFILMNNPVRAISQEHIEIKRLRKQAQLPAESTVLEIGCGNGNGARLIKKYFSPAYIQATDLDERMVALAEKTNKDDTITFQQANACELPFPDNTFDAVFDFGIIHHIPNWKDCIKEIRRVLKPEGQLIAEDLSIDTFSTLLGSVLRRILTHPYDYMYTEKQFVQELKNNSFNIQSHQSPYPLKLFKYFTVVASKS